MPAYISNGLIVHELIHGAAGLISAFILWKKTKSVKRALLVVFLTIAFDIDHLVDYFLYYGFQISVPKMLMLDYFQITRRAVVPFHAWEWLMVLGVLSYKRGWKSNFTLLFMAILPHLIVDSINVSSFLFYSIIYRLARGFAFLN